MPHNRGFAKSPTSKDGPVIPSGQDLPLGVYHGPGEVAQCAAFEERVGPLPWRLDFADEGRMFSAAQSAGPGPHLAGDPGAVDVYPIRTWKDCNRKLLLAMPMIPACPPGQGSTGFAAVAAGAYDAAFTMQAEALLANDFAVANTMVRLGWEFNGDWFPWAANTMAAEFVAAFRRIVTVLRRTIPGLPTMWNPTRGDFGVGNLAQYWPGAEYVSCAALDVYDTEWRVGPIREPQEFHHILTQRYGLAWLADFAKLEGVEVGLGEWGLCPIGKAGVDTQRGAGDDPTFVLNMVKWIKDHATGPCIIWDDQGIFSSNGNSVEQLRAAIS